MSAIKPYPTFQVEAGLIPHYPTTYGSDIKHQFGHHQNINLKNITDEQKFALCGYILYNYKRILTEGDAFQLDEVYNRPGDFRLPFVNKFIQLWTNGMDAACLAANERQRKYGKFFEFFS